MQQKQRLVLIGNGFDLAHGLRTTYKDFLNWYLCKAFNMFRAQNAYMDNLLELKYKYANHVARFDELKNMHEVIDTLSNDDRWGISFKTKFFSNLIKDFYAGTWVNIECEYYQQLKRIFNANSNSHQKNESAKQLNQEFDFMIKKLSEYFMEVNSQLGNVKQLPFKNPWLGLKELFKEDSSLPVTFLNFNYTETLVALGYANENEVIHIHGRVSNNNINPIIFGYGDESDPTYQLIEDTGENAYLDHIKSFGYFKTNNYSKLLATLDAKPYTVYILARRSSYSASPRHMAIRRSRRRLRTR